MVKNREGVEVKVCKVLKQLRLLYSLKSGLIIEHPNV